ncbi:NUDIX hydrolase [Oxynema aestuarii]|jgi:8-oxo-dGTP pyrophosphatase MutT (NUDIX family)|uniref:NUDIX hydrolase n=1 Tax=Oxynema aestuarii AP17 TaxID=2064643 RepID=A0A6H1U490_9CYAN|nr:NUDIX hydrolase [Oxynema aestuarii]QIZ73651.1 NUDIX hydrolase [Oxynema aestuarii AP17]RMH73306.1 MAG: NUDIX domain-containing protein [Cyanobacteria bacterium J007]
MGSKNKNKIRVLALGIIRDRDRLFVAEGYDENDQPFYRVLGGGIDFGETSRDALIREFQEEIQAELTNIRYITCLESIFFHKGKPGHEIIQLYQCDFADPQFYDAEPMMFSEGERQKRALWVEISRFESGELRIVPENFLDYVQ